MVQDSFGSDHLPVLTTLNDKPALQVNSATLSLAHWVESITADGKKHVTCMYCEYKIVQHAPGAKRHIAVQCANAPEAVKAIFEADVCVAQCDHDQAKTLSLSHFVAKHHRQRQLGNIVT